MSWVTVAIMVGTAVAGEVESQKVAKAQDNSLAQEMTQQQATEKKNAAATAAMVANQKKQPQQTQQTAATSEQKFQQALKANASTSAAPLNAIGDVSSAYKKAKQNAALGVADNVNTFSNLTASMAAPGRTRQANQGALADYGIGMNLNNQAQAGQDYVDQLKRQSIRTSPWLSMLLSGASGYAKGAGIANAGGGGAGVGPNDPWSGAGYSGVTPGIDDTSGATAAAYT